MNILAIESTGKIASVAIINSQENKILGLTTLNSGYTHSQTLLPIINDLLKNLNLMPEQINYVACSSGPGSFTGIKIGVATAKAFAHALNIKIISVPTLDALAMNIFSQDKIIVPILDSRREQIYGAIYINKNFYPCRISDYLNCDIKQIISDAINLKSKLNKQILFLGDGVEPNKKILLENNISLVPEHLNCQSAQNIALYAKKILSESDLKSNSESKYITDYKTFLPFYLRKPQAEQNLLNH